jgi:hypothetical protein
VCAWAALLVVVSSSDLVSPYYEHAFAFASVYRERPALKRARKKTINHRLAAAWPA